MELVIALTNIIFGIFPLIKLIEINRYCGVILLCMSIIAATLMNITRDLPNLCSTKYMKIFKYTDKLMAHIVAFYCMYLFYINPNKNVMQIITPIIGLIILQICDSIKNVEIFGIMQIIWHALAYSSIYLIIP